MKNKHTPGPWKAIKPGHGHKTKYLCVQVGEDETYSTLELLPADAHLIAAAPALALAWEMVPEETKQRILDALHKPDTEWVEATLATLS